MFRPNFERELVEEESCEENILLRDPSHSTLDVYVHAHALTTGLIVLMIFFMFCPHTAGAPITAGTHKGGVQ